MLTQSTHRKEMDIYIYIYACLPVMSSTNTHPSPHQSTGKLCVAFKLLPTNSGAIYMTVPQPSCRGGGPPDCEASNSTAKPKSQSRTWPSLSRRIFSGFKSLSKHQPEFYI